MITKFGNLVLKSTSTPMTFDVYENYIGKDKKTVKEKLYGYNMPLRGIAMKFVNDSLEKIYKVDEEVSFKEFINKSKKFLKMFDKYVSDNMDSLKQMD